MDSFNFILTFVLGILLIYFLLPRKKPKNFPPGPQAIIPFFGNIVEMGDMAHQKIMKLTEKYGPIIGLQFGSYWTVTLNNADDIREAFARPDFSSRFGYNPFLEENISTKTMGVVMSYGQTWVNNRRLCLKGLKDHGFGKRSMESIIQEEVRNLMDELKKNLNTPISTHRLFNASVLNVIWSIVAGERFQLNDQKLAQLLRFINELMKNSFSGLKILNFMFPTLASWREVLQIYFPDENKIRLELLKSFLKKTVQDHRESIQIGNPRDFIDTYLEERIKAGEEDPNSAENDLNIIFTLVDLFGAGSDTTSTTLNWALFLLALHPAAQKKLYEEIQSVVGNRVVGLDDRLQLPFLEATMSEIYRMSSLAPMSVQHSTTRDVTFKNFYIPKDCMIFGNFYAVHFSKETWGDPHTFRPERFLSQDGLSYIEHPNLIPFSVGKRQCLGKSLAKDEFFLFLTNIVQQLKISFPPDEPHHSMEGQDGLILTPETHRIILLDRFN